MMTATGLWAQKKELSQARTYIKSGKDYDKAEKLMTGLLADTTHRKNTKVYATWYDAVAGQYAQANEKLYLKQKYDTAAFFNITKRMYLIAESLRRKARLPDSTWNSWWTISRTSMNPTRTIPTVRIPIF